MKGEISCRTTGVLLKYLRKIFQIIREIKRYDRHRGTIRGSGAIKLLGNMMFQGRIFEMANRTTLPLGKHALVSFARLL